MSGARNAGVDRSGECVGTWWSIRSVGDGLLGIVGVGIAVILGYGHGQLGRTEHQRDASQEPRAVVMHGDTLRPDSTRWRVWMRRTLWQHRGMHGPMWQGVTEVLYEGLEIEGRQGRAQPMTMRIGVQPEGRALEQGAYRFSREDGWTWVGAPVAGSPNPGTWPETLVVHAPEHPMGPLE